MNQKNYSYVPWYIIAYKFLFGLIEALSGFAILFFGKNAYVLYHSVIYEELSESPHVYLASLSRNLIPMLLGHHTSLIIYLILLGIAKIAGAIGLIYHQNWGVDLLVGMTIVLLPFQTINLLLHPSVFDFIYIILGLLIALYLIDFQPKNWAGKIIRHVKKTKA